MKMTHYSILALALMMSGNALSMQTEKTDNYAYGAELIIQNNESMFSRVELNHDVYTQTVSSQLDDLRVFNHNGQTVPFSLVNVYDTTQTKQQFDMTLYPINQNKTITENSSGQNNYAVSVQGQNVNISVDHSNTSKGKYVATYLLQIPTESNIVDPISNLQLQFTEQQNWQATADVSYSTDLRYWRSVVNNVPLMTLTNSDNQALTLSDISFTPYSYYKNKNWLITLHSQQPIPSLTKVIASSQKESVKNTLYPINFSLESSDNHSAIYSLPSAQPVKTLSIELNNTRTILPLSIFYKSNRNDTTWIKLEDRIIRKTNYDDKPTHISLNGRLISQIKIETIKSSNMEDAPTLIALRNQVNLVFNSANNAPFVLAWGSINAKAASLSESALLTDKESVLSLPEAFIGQPVKLAGDQALKAKNQEEQSGFPRWIIWLGLIIGAGVLVLLALKLFKEVKNQEIK